MLRKSFGNEFINLIASADFHYSHTKFPLERPHVISFNFDVILCSKDRAFMGQEY